MIAPERFARISAYEQRFGRTIHRTKSVERLAAEGTPYAGITPERIAIAATRETYRAPVRCAPDVWELPLGAFGRSDGPS